MSETEIQKRTVRIEVPLVSRLDSRPMPGWAVAVKDAVTGELIPTVTNAEVRIGATADGTVTARLRMFATEDGEPVYLGDAMVIDQLGEVITAEFTFYVAGFDFRVGEIRAPRGRNPWRPWEQEQAVEGERLGEVPS
ncbi:MAG TPA: hypothetical protein VMU95_41090 [Trebonia sp.]|nr:hypothetical protein [Trebonia sp.]